MSVIINEYFNNNVIKVERSICHCGDNVSLVSEGDEGIHRGSGEVHRDISLGAQVLSNARLMSTTVYLTQNPP